MQKKSAAKKNGKRKAPAAFDPVKLSKVTVDRSEAVQAVMAEEPDFNDNTGAWAYAAKNGLPMSHVAAMYDVLQDAALAEPIFSAGRKAEYRLGITQTMYRRMPKVEALPAYLPTDPQRGVPVDAQTREGTQAASRYLHTAVLGHVRRMLARLHANGQDVRGEAEALIGEIRAVVDELLETGAA